MTYIENIRASFGGVSSDGMMYYDAFQRQRVSNPYTIFDSKSIRDKMPLFWDESVTGVGASSTFQSGKSCVKLSVSPASVGTVIRQSKIWGTYQAGKSQLILMTANFNENGTFKVVKRSKATGLVVDTAISQSSFNVDKMDGTGITGFDLDFTKSQRFGIDFEWLAVGDIRYGVILENKILPMHAIYNTNTLDNTEVVYMTTPNLPLRYEISSDGAGNITKRVGYFNESNGLFFEMVGTDGDLYHICGTIISEGGQEQVAIEGYVSRNGTPITLANQDIYTPIVSLRKKSSANSGTAPDIEGLCTKVLPISAEILSTSAINYEWRLVLNPTIGGVDAASWVNVTDTAIQYDVSRTNANTITGGYVIAGGYGSSSNTVKLASDASAKSFLGLGANINNTTDQLVLAVANVDGNGGSVYGGISFMEYC